MLTSAEDLIKLACCRPRSLNNFISSLSCNDSFLVNIQKNSHKIRLILDSDNPPRELKDALFIVDLNKFRSDFVEIIKILDRRKLEEQKIDLENALDDSQESRVRAFVSRAGKFFRDAFNYQKYFQDRYLLPSIEGKPLMFDLWPNFPFTYKEAETVLENARKAEASFQHYREYFKNFVNVVYSDGDEGEKFLGVKFGRIACEYSWLNRGGESASKDCEKC